MVISLAVAALRNPVTVIYSVAPYAVLIFLFGGFVAWNGGVVLGMFSMAPTFAQNPSLIFYTRYRR